MEVPPLKVNVDEEAEVLLLDAADTEDLGSVLDSMQGTLTSPSLLPSPTAASLAWQELDDCVPHIPAEQEPSSLRPANALAAVAPHGVGVKVGERVGRAKDSSVGAQPAVTTTAVPSDDVSALAVPSTAGYASAGSDATSTGALSDEATPIATPVASGAGEGVLVAAAPATSTAPTTAAPRKQKRKRNSSGGGAARAKGAGGGGAAAPHLSVASAVETMPSVADAAKHLHSEEALEAAARESGIDLSSLSESELKKQRRLLRNRLSAQLHRERKRALIDELQGRIEVLQSENASLRSQNEALAAERDAARRQLAALAAKLQSDTAAEQRAVDYVPAPATSQVADCPLSPGDDTDESGHGSDASPSTSPSSSPRSSRSASTTASSSPGEEMSSSDDETPPLLRTTSGDSVAGVAPSSLHRASTGGSGWAALDALIAEWGSPDSSAEGDDTVTAPPPAKKQQRSGAVRPPRARVAALGSLLLVGLTTMQGQPPADPATTAPAPGITPPIALHRGEALPAFDALPEDDELVRSLAMLPPPDAAHDEGGKEVVTAHSTATPASALQPARTLHDAPVPSLPEPLHVLDGDGGGSGDGLVHRLLYASRTPENHPPSLEEVAARSKALQLANWSAVAGVNLSKLDLHVQQQERATGSLRGARGATRARSGSAANSSLVVCEQAMGWLEGPERAMSSREASPSSSSSSPSRSEHMGYAASPGKEAPLSGAMTSWGQGASHPVVGEPTFSSSQSGAQGSSLMLMLPARDVLVSPSLGLSSTAAPAHAKANATALAPYHSKRADGTRRGGGDETGTDAVANNDDWLQLSCVVTDVRRIQRSAGTEAA